MVTAKTEDSDIVTGLELGADDYVSKPFSPRVLIARVQSVLRRRNRINENSSTSSSKIEPQPDLKQSDTPPPPEKIFFLI